MNNNINFNNLIGLMEDEYFIKTYDSFKYANNGGNAYIIITNKRFFLLSYFNKRGYDNVMINACSLRDISGLKLEYGYKVKPEQVFWSGFSLFFSLLFLFFGVFSLIHNKLFITITFLFCFLSTLAAAILLFIFKYRKIFFLEVYQNFSKDKFLSVSSKNYQSNFSKTIAAGESADTFKMLKELSLEIQKAKEIKLSRPVIIKEEVVVEEKVLGENIVQLVPSE